MPPRDRDQLKKQQVIQFKKLSLNTNRGLSIMPGNEDRKMRESKESKF
jgi:hypothetical protein